MTTIPRDIEDLLRRHLSAEFPADDGLVLHTRSKNRGGLLRLPLKNGGSIIVKIWLARNVRERIKSILHLSNGRREWKMHRFIHRAGILTPKPLWFRRLTLTSNESCEAMAIEDLGETESGLPHLKKLITTADEAGIVAFEDKLIVATERFIDRHIIDIDHQLNNFVVDAQGRLMRVDFECAKRYRLGLVPKPDYAQMIARLLASHIYAVQPDTKRTENFSARLYERLAVNSEYKKMIKEMVNKKMLLQQRKVGVATEISLPV